MFWLINSVRHIFQEFLIHIYLQVVHHAYFLIYSIHVHSPIHVFYYLLVCRYSWFVFVFLIEGFYRNGFISWFISPCRFVCLLIDLTRCKIGVLWSTLYFFWILLFHFRFTMNANPYQTATGIQLQRFLYPWLQTLIISNVFILFLSLALHTKCPELMPWQ